MNHSQPRHFRPIFLLPLYPLIPGALSIKGYAESC